MKFFQTLFFFFFFGGGSFFSFQTFSFLSAAPGFNPFLIIDSLPVCKGLVLATVLLVRVSKASRPVVAGVCLVVMSRR